MHVDRMYVRIDQWLRRALQVRVAVAALDQSPRLAAVVRAQRAANFYGRVSALPMERERPHAAGAIRVGQKPLVLVTQPSDFRALAPVRGAVVGNENAR